MKRGLESFPAGQVAAFRISIAGIILLPLALMKWRETNLRHQPKLFLSGMMGVFIPAFLFVKAQEHIASSVAGILNTLSPLWTMIMGAWVYRQIFKRAAVSGIFLGLIGTVILMWSRAGSGTLGFNAYGLLIVLACSFYGFNLNFVKFNIADLRPLTITSISVVLTMPLAVIYLFGFTDFVHIAQTQPGAYRSMGYIMILALMSTAVAGYLFNKLVKLTTPLFASTVTYIMPVVSVMWGVLDGEKLYLMHYVGMAAILGGVYLANKKWD